MSKKIKLPPPEGVIFVPFSPNSMLRKEIEKVEKIINAGNIHIKLRVVEHYGNKLEEIVCNKTPWKREPCSNMATCAPCAMLPGSCRKTNITYKIVCATCAVKGVSSIYYGESHKTWLDHCGKHQKAVANGNIQYATVRHHLEQHQGFTPFSHTIMLPVTRPAWKGK